MTDNEKRKQVINGLECCKQWSDAGIYEGYQPVLCESCPRAELQIDVEECHEALLNDAIALLKVQEPVKPVVDIDTWKCGNCGHALEHQQLLGDNVLFHEQYNYCPECGKAVKWE